MNERSARPRQPQYTLLTLLILTASIACWTGYWKAKTRTTEIQRQLVGLRNVARELVVDDPHQFAVVRRVPQRNGEHIWDLFVPDENDFELVLSLSGDVTTGFIPAEIPMPDPDELVALPPGRHKIEMLSDRNKKTLDVQIFVDDASLLKSSKAFTGGTTWGSSVNNPISTSRQQTTSRPLVIHNKNYSGQSNLGTKLWIRAKSAKSAAETQ